MKFAACLLVVTVLTLPILTCSDDNGSQPDVDPGWVPLGDGIGAGIEGYVVSALAVHEGNLIASGHEIKPGEQTWPCEVWRWNAPNWERLGTQFNHFVSDLVVWNGTLVAVGNFTADRREVHTRGQHDHPEHRRAERWHLAVG